MNTRKISECRLHWMTAALLVATLAGPAYATSPNDAWITSKAKMALMTADGVNPMEINVDTVGRKVTLHGTVDTKEEKQKAEEAVRSIDGVTSVRNLLKVGGSDTAAAAARKSDATARSDDQITKDVRTALANRQSLDDSTITVSSVDHGVVKLTGQADDMGDRMTAIRAARSVAGVKRVSADIQGPETYDDPEASADASDESVTGKARDTAESAGHAVTDTAKSAGHAVTDTAKSAGHTAAHAAKATGEAVSDTTRSAASAAHDMYTTSMVKTRLLADKDTPALDINVDTDDGVVTLFGEVPSATAKTRATEEAQKVSGVKKVRNELQVVSTAKHENVKADDREVATDVKKNLHENSLDDVSVDVKNCVVRLTGKVPSRQDRVEAMQVARATRGVCAVEDNLSR